MSKSANSYMLPVFGGVALVVGLGFGVANRNYGDNRISVLEDRLGQMETQASDAATQVSAAAESAAAEAARAAELEAEVARIQAEAATKMASGATMTEPAPMADGRYGLGREAHVEEIAAWDVDVLPDGRGLPEGSGDVFTGEEVFADRCASCHGDFAEGVDNWPVLAGGFDTLADKDPVKTVGSYWPYLSTVFDYVSRSMPFGEAQTLTADETYAIVAYILYSNDLVDDEFEIGKDNFAEFEMYNTDGFVIDDREALEYSQWRTEPCMENCKESVEITMRATFLDVTPEGGGDSVMNDAKVGDTPTFSADSSATETTEEEAQIASFETVTEDDAAAGATDAAPSPEMVAAGEKAFKQCKSCHAVGAGAKNKVGPALNGIVGNPVGAVEGFKYSNPMKAAAADGMVWDAETLTAFLADPKGFMKGTKMSFRGLKKDEDIQGMIAYLATFQAE